MALRRTIVVLLAVAVAGGCAAHTQPRLDRSASEDRRGALAAGTVAANIWYVPGRALTCAGAAVLAGAAMTITFGQSYDSASDLMHGGCSGPWVLRAEDVR